MTMSLTRAKLEELTDNLISKTFEPVKKALKDAGVAVADISDVVMVGGMTRMPKIISEVEKYFGKKPHQGVNPDEVVAIGAAIQAGVIAGDVQDVVLLDVTPLTLGVETLGGIRTPLINRNTTLPTSGNQIFSTAADNQTSVEINVLQGEREMAADNKSLGRFILDGIPPAPRGMPQVEVKFDIDSNGILKVSATDKTSGKEANITIANSTNLSDEEIEKMKQEAEVNAEADKAKKELVEARNQGNSVAFEVEKQLSEYGDKLGDKAEKEKIEANVKALKDLVADENATKEQIDTAVQETLASAQKIGEAMQKAQAEEAQQGGGEAPAAAETADSDKKDAKPTEGEVVEGEVVN